MKFLNLDIRRARPRAINTVFKEHFGDKQVVGAEIGVWKGENAREMLKLLNLKCLFLVDAYRDYEGYNRIDQDDFGKIEAIAKKNLKGFNNIAWINDYSFYKTLDFPLDFVYIDGNHSYEYVLADISNYYPKVRTGGIIAGDDIETEGVAKAVLEFANNNTLVIRIAGRSWYIIK